MKQRNRLFPAFFVAVIAMIVSGCFAGCASNPLQPPNATPAQKFAAAYYETTVGIDQVVQGANIALKANQLSPQKAQVIDQAVIAARAGLKSARTAAKADPTGALSMLDGITAGLAIAQSYLPPQPPAAPASAASGASK